MRNNELAAWAKSHLRLVIEVEQGRSHLELHGVSGASPAKRFALLQVRETVPDSSLYRSHESWTTISKVEVP